MWLAQIQAVLEMVAEVLEGKNPGFDLVDVTELTEECLTDLSRMVSGGTALAEACRHLSLMLDGLKNHDRVDAGIQARRAVNAIDRYRLEVRTFSLDGDGDLVYAIVSVVKPVRFRVRWPP
jgi:hypothetical protein